jgi:hypothetical protein
MRFGFVCWGGGTGNVLAVAIALAVIGIAAALAHRARTRPLAPPPVPALRLVPGTADRLPEVPADSLDRKRRSDARLRGEGVPVNLWLPVIESEADTALPSVEEVAMRGVAALVVAARASGMPQEQVNALVREYRLDDWFSPDERAFMAQAEPPAEERGIRRWRFEAANVLFWALGFVGHLGAPTAQCDPRALVALVQGQSRAALLAAARPRPVAEVLDEADLIYRYRWALVDARIKDAAAPAGLDDDVAMERHHAFNWLVQHADTDWDDISFDT